MSPCRPRCRSVVRRLVALGAALGAAGATTAALAQPLRAGPLTVRSCAGSDVLEIDLRGDAAMLDEADRQGAAAAMLQRYPVLAQGVFEPVAIVLWRRPGAGWIYVALSTPQQPPPAWCFSATFAAQVFEFTPALQRKYFAVGAART